MEFGDDDTFAPAHPAPPADNGPSPDFGVFASAGENGNAVPAAPLDDGLFGVLPAAEPAPEAETQGSVGDTADAFFSTYTPHPTEPAPAPAPQEVDPRIEWRKQNAEVLKKKDAEEAAAKQQLLTKAQEHLKRFYEVRGTTLNTRKATNRKSEAVAKEAEVPVTGTPWEKVHALVNFSAGGNQKDVARYKSVLITCKAKNVAIRA